jgi:predicted  nucleic acid-binding Zn-ribbon protein
MELVARVVLTGFDGGPVDAVVALEGFDLRQKAWRSVPEILKPLPAAPKASRDGVVQRIAFPLNEVTITALFAATAFFRLVTPSARDGGQSQVILASPRVTWNAERVEVDFGNVLFLGERAGFVTAAGDGGAFCAGVALAEDAALAAAQRRLYAGAGDSGEVAAERDRLKARLAELERTNAAAAKALATCETAGARLTRDNAALTQQAQKAAADLQTCVGERGKLTDQLTAATARATAAEANLKACTTERERNSAELAVQGRALATATVDLQTCTIERGKLAEQLTAAAARATAAETSLKACNSARERTATELAACTKALAAATAERDACAAARQALIAELAEVRAGFDATMTQWEGLRVEFLQASEALAKAESDLAACGARTVELEAAIRESGFALEASRLAAAEADRRARDAEKAHVALNDRLLAMEAEGRMRADELAELRERISDEQAYVGRLRDSLVAETARAGVAAEQLEAVRLQHRSEMPATQLISSLATSFGQIDRQLVSTDMPYRLGRTNIRLRTLFSADGERMFLPDAGYRIDDAALSEVSVELIPDAPVAPAVSGSAIPDLIGLTETAAIRVLSSLSLKADKAIETVVGAPEKHGRALHQIPPPGSPAQKGQTVLVIYGALEGA